MKKKTICQTIDENITVKFCNKRIKTSLIRFFSIHYFISEYVLSVLSHWELQSNMIALVQILYIRRLVDLLKKKT